MNDCPNAEIRDYLPDLLHGRLDAATRARVEAHVAACADCRAELATLRELRATLRVAPAVDVAAIVAAIPSRASTPTRRWTAVRIAAAAVLLVGGASSLWLLKREQPAGTPVNQVVVNIPDSAPVAPAPVVKAPVTPAPVESVAKPRTVASTSGSETIKPVRELAMGGSGLSDLSDRELTALLKAIDALDAVPTTDVETGSLAPVSHRIMR